MERSLWGCCVAQRSRPGRRRPEPSRGIEVPLGTPGDGPSDWTVHGLAARKNEMYLELRGQHGVRVLGDTVGGRRGRASWRLRVDLGAMARTIDIVTRSFAGVQLQDAAVTFDPRLPEGLAAVSFTLVHRGQRPAMHEVLGTFDVSGRRPVSASRRSAG